MLTSISNIKISFKLHLSERTRQKLKLGQKRAQTIMISRMHLSHDEKVVMVFIYVSWLDPRGHWIPSRGKIAVLN